MEQKLINIDGCTLLKFDRQHLEFNETEIFDGLHSILIFTSSKIAPVTILKHFDQKATVSTLLILKWSK